MTYIEELNKLTGGKYSYVRDNRVTVSVGSKKVSITLLVPASLKDDFGDAQKTEIENATRKIIPEDFSVDLSFKKVSPGIESTRRDVVEFFNKNFLSLISQIGTDDISIETEENRVKVEIALFSHLFGFASKEELDAKLKAYLEHCVCADVSVILLDKGAQTEDIVRIDPMIEMHDRHIVPEKICSIYGREINRFANFICDSSEQVDNVVLAGKIIGISEKTSQKNKTLFYCFDLNDNTGSISCRIFTKKPEKGVISELKDGDVVIASGNIRFDEYSRRNSFIINSLAKCDVDFSKVSSNTVYKSENDDYLCVRPRPYAEKVQATFFMGKEEVADYLLTRDAVVFDFETTGLNPDNDMITEIGAVKLIKGVITEYFSTFINPERHIPSEVTEKTHITDEMVKDAPLISDVIGDFYKFTRGSVLVGHNIVGFDMLFLRRFAEKNHYMIDNNVKDTLDMARKYLTGLPNYKLATVCEHLNISLEGAHRAYNDCVANAKVFKHLAKYL